MATDRNNNTDTQEQSLPEGRPANHNGNRPIFTLTMDPNALEQEIDQASQALQSTFNSLFNSMQTSVFGGLDSLQKEMSTFERSSREYIEQHPLYHNHIQYFPWAFRNDGSRRRYRITIEEIPPLENEKPSKVFSTLTDSSITNDGNDEEFTITQGMAGTPDEGKTVITTSASPGLLDWLLFTTHDDSFFRRLGQTNTESTSTSVDGEIKPKIKEISEVNHSIQEQEKEASKQSIVPALVEKVKQVGTNWEKDARHWWQGRRTTEQGDQNPSDSDNHSGSWPRVRSWGHSESFSQTTVTRPDGTVEHRSVNNVDGETETVIKIRYPDGSVEETITRENNGKNRWRSRRQDDEDRERESITSVVQEAFATEEQKGSEKSKSWPPKAWIRRQERDE
ncbi:hypothetical protein BGZ76_005359 [Entomortierella beljakovae]|nr:hypothetical protein BGZ76_005359 [Entomortierella beljakovae]